MFSLKSIQRVVSCGHVVPSLSQINLYSLLAVAPRRAVLYIPGNDRRKIAKLGALKVDCAVLDCEDGVAENRKDEARATIQDVYRTVSKDHKHVAVRINSIGSGHEKKDLDAVLPVKPSCLLVPKVESVEHVKWIYDNIRRNTDASYSLPLIMYVESAISLLRLPSICEEATKLSKTSQVRLEGLVFGSDDFVADIGAERTPDASELMYARQKFVAVAKAFRLQAIDMVHIDFKDSEGLRKQSIAGAKMGFTGKQVIHPSQVPIVQDAFSPSREKVEWAAALVEAFQHHQSSGKGAFTFRGSMIDMPLLLQAKNILAAADQPT